MYLEKKASTAADLEVAKRRALARMGQRGLGFTATNRIELKDWVGDQPTGGYFWGLFAEWGKARDETKKVGGAFREQAQRVAMVADKGISDIANALRDAKGFEGVSAVEDQRAALETISRWYEETKAAAAARVADYEALVKAGDEHDAGPGQGGQSHVWPEIKERVSKVADALGAMVLDTQNKLKDVAQRSTDLVAAVREAREAARSAAAAAQAAAQRRAAQERGAQEQAVEAKEQEEQAKKASVYTAIEEAQALASEGDFDAALARLRDPAVVQAATETRMIGDIRTVTASINSQRRAQQSVESRQKAAEERAAREQQERRAAMEEEKRSREEERAAEERRRADVFKAQMEAQRQATEAAREERESIRAEREAARQREVEQRAVEVAAAREERAAAREEEQRREQRDLLLKLLPSLGPEGAKLLPLLFGTTRGVVPPPETSPPPLPPPPPPPPSRPFTRRGDERF